MRLLHVSLPLESAPLESAPHESLIARNSGEILTLANPTVWWSSFGGEEDLTTFGLICREIEALEDRSEMKESMKFAVLFRPLGFAFLLLISASAAAAESGRATAQEREIDKAVQKEHQRVREISGERADSLPPAKVSSPQTEEVSEPLPEKKKEHSWGVAALLYLPNRILDVFDMFRIRARVGPGVAVGARVTKYVQAYVGTYASVYAGLPGPRLEPFPHSPIGFETYNGIALSVLDATADGGFGPEYSVSEIGAGVQLAILGVDVGFDPVELVDFFAGLFGADIREDDF